jgi:hypothetical protein
VALLTHMCGTFTVPSFRQDGNLYPRQLLPASVMDSLSRLHGVFEYGKRVLSSTVSQGDSKCLTTIKQCDKHTLVPILNFKPRLYSVQRLSL